MSAVNKLLCRVKNGSDSANSTETSAMSASQQKPEEQLKAFIAEDPNSRYSFDSERNAPRSEICREGKEKSRKCITLMMHSTAMFSAMQAQGFFCALPMEPGRTHMECQRIPGS